jgi:hypothetical protein
MLNPPLIVQQLVEFKNGLRALLRRIHVQCRDKDSFSTSSKRCVPGEWVKIIFSHKALQNLLGKWIIDDQLFVCLHDDMKPFTSDLEVLSCNPSRVYRFLVKAACKPCRLLSDLEHFWSFPSKNEGVLIK